jgi:hypothetical protein
LRNYLYLKQEKFYQALVYFFDELLKSYKILVSLSRSSQQNDGHRSDAQE